MSDDEDIEIEAYPLRSYQLIADPNRPDLVALAFETERGHSLYLASRAVLEDLGNDLLARAAKMPEHKTVG
jgi:hypothetical protein